MSKKRLTLLVIIVIIAIIAVIMQLIPKINTVEVPSTDIDLGIVQSTEINMDEVEQKLYESKKENIENILIMGIDGNNYKSARSDVIIIATINKREKTLKLTSVMRDTLSYLPISNTYEKINHSYMKGGPVETMRAINTNLDLDIKNFVTFNYNALKEAVNFINGYPVHVNANEARDMGISPGEQVLFGNDALNYVRVRQNSGGDPGRNQRQRDLIMYIMKYSKNMSKLEMLKFANKMIPLVETSYSYSDIEELINLYIGLRDSLEIEQYSFPYEYKGGIFQDKVWYAVPRNWESNVIQLQKNIYEENNGYIPSDTVYKINNYVEKWSKVTK